MSLIVYRLPSRRLKTVVSIPWAEPAPAVDTPFVATQPQTTERRKGRSREEISLSILVKEIPDDVPFVATRPQITQRRKGRARQEISLDVIVKVIPPEASEFMPAWLFKPANQSSFKRTLILVPQINQYPATPPTPEQPPTAFLEPKLFRRHQLRIQVKTLEIDSYPETPVAPAGATFGVFSLIDDSGQGTIGIIDASGNGLESLIDADGQGVVSIIDASGEGTGSQI